MQKIYLSAFLRIRKQAHILNFIFLSVFFTLFTPLLYAASSRFLFEEFSLKEGLSQSIVECIVQDSYGFLWMGTEDGLNKFDGYHFKAFRHNDQKPSSLSYNEVTSIAADNIGNLWVGTFYGGLNYYNQKTGQFTVFRHNPEDIGSISHNNIKCVFIDSKNSLWVGTENGINKYLKETQSFKHYNFCNNTNNTVRVIYEDKGHTFWAGTDNGLFFFNETTELFCRKPEIEHSGNPLSSQIVYALVEDSLNNLWAGTDTGLFSYNRNSHKVNVYKNIPNDSKTISNNDIRALFEDDENQLWVGTHGGGLNLLKREDYSFIRFIADASDSGSISYNEITSIFQDTSGVLWIGTYGGGVNKVNRKHKLFNTYRPETSSSGNMNHEIIWTVFEDSNGIIWIGSHGGGLIRLNRASGEKKVYTENNTKAGSLTHNIVRIVYEDTHNNLWIGTDGGGLDLYDPDSDSFIPFRHKPDDPSSISHNRIRWIYEDTEGFLWIGTYGGGLNKLLNLETKLFKHYIHDADNPESLSNNFVRAILEDSKKRLWIGTQGGGLNILDTQADTFTHFRADPENPESLSNDYIFTILEDHDRNLWFGTWGSGICTYNEKSGTFLSYSEKEGLANNAIYGLLEDSKGNLWMSTNLGISKFNPATGVFTNYDETDGLQSNEFNGGSYYKSASGEMFFGGIHGFNYFNPDNIIRSQFIPQVFITSVYIMNHEVESDCPIYLTNSLELSYRDYLFSLEFTALDFTSPQKNHYEYKMEGVDTSWIKTTADKRFATYTTLKPGNYTFKVKGTNSDEVWNQNVTKLEVIIHPSFWGTWWFKTLSTVLIVSILTFLTRTFLKNVKITTELKAAQNAQKSIMPHYNPSLEGFEISGTCLPAHEVGGDFYDYFNIGENGDLFGFTLGDVSGKSLNSAMVAVMTSGMIYSQIEEGIDISKVMKKLNHCMYNKTEKKMFTALVFGLLDINKKKLSFINAGMESPILKNNGKAISVTSTGTRLPLGSVKHIEYKETVVQMKSGDVMIFFTDGISEAVNHSRGFFGKESLLKQIESIQSDTMNASDIKNSILNAVKSFTGSAKQYDDITLLVIKAV